MKRILLVSPFPPYIGGVSVSVNRLYYKLKDDGLQVHKYDIHYLNKTLNKYKILLFLRFLFLPLYLMLSKRFDVIHFHVSGDLTKAYVSFFRFLFSEKSKFISTIHGDVTNLLNKRFGKTCLSGFDLIICVKEGDASILSKYYKVSIKEIPAFIPPSCNNFEALPKEVLDFFKSAPLKITIMGSVICDENYYDLYGLKDAIVLVNKLKKEKKDIKLFLINLGNKSGRIGLSYLLELKKYINENNLDDYVYIYEGTTLDFMSVLKETDIFIRPTMTDGDALSIREALYLKIPTIASNIVDRPNGTILYDRLDPFDLYKKTLNVINNYKFYKNNFFSINTDFYNEIKKSYEI